MVVNGKDPGSLSPSLSLSTTPLVIWSEIYSDVFKPKVFRSFKIADINLKKIGATGETNFIACAQRHHDRGSFLLFFFHTHA